MRDRECCSVLCGAFKSLDRCLHVDLDRDLDANDYGARLLPTPGLGPGVGAMLGWVIRGLWVLLLYFVHSFFD